MPNKKTTSKKARGDKVATEATKLVAQAYALLKRGGCKDAIDGLAVACTQVVRIDGACFVPITTHTFKKLFTLPDVDGKLPAKKARREYVDSLFMQRGDAGLALVGSIKVWDETDGVGRVRF